mgnify:CR=1 FL=1
MITIKNNSQYRVLAGFLGRLRPLACALLAAAAVTLSACATLPEAHMASSGREAAATGLDPALQQFLSDAPAASVLALADSPWGANVIISVQEPYYAASGRICRALTVESGAGSWPGLVCRLPDGGWQAVRVLHYQGRPLLSSAPERAESGVAQ